MTHHASIRRRASRREGGQALVEFVLVLFPLVVFVGGVIQLGIGISNWHDLNRIAYEGARFAATEEWPGCPAQTGTPTPCNGNPVCHPTNPSTLNGRSLQNYLRCEVIDAGLPSTTSVVICRSGSSTEIGNPITVKLQSRLNFLSSGEVADTSAKVTWFGVTLRGQATMMLETTPTKYTAGAC